MNNKPLTLKELESREKPVWVPDGDNDGFWCLCIHGTIIPPSGISFDAASRLWWNFLDHKPEDKL